MKVAIGADHGAFERKAEVIEHFSKKEIKGEIVIVLEGRDVSGNVSTDDDSDE